MASKTEFTPSQKISGQILSLVVGGMDLRTAYDAVLGEGTYSKLASEIWEAAQAKAAQR